MNNMADAVYDAERYGPIPPRFVSGCKGDIVAAGQRWAATAEWRAREGIDGLLTEPQPNFEYFKRYYPQFVHGRARNGNYVYYEQPGLANFKALTEV